VREPAQLYYGSISTARVIKDYFWYSLAVHIFRDTDRAAEPRMPPRRAAKPVLSDRMLFQRSEAEDVYDTSKIGVASLESKKPGIKARLFRPPI